MSEIEKALEEILESLEVVEIEYMDDFGKVREI